MSGPRRDGPPEERINDKGGETMPRSKLRIAGRWMAGIALLGAASLAAIAPGHAKTRAEPFPAWPEPQVEQTMSVEQAKTIVAERTKPQTEWHGPTAGPRASTEKVTIAWVSGDESYSTYIGWGNGVRQAAKALGWTVVTFNGQGTVSGQLAAMQQALASNPTAIITPADANALQRPIKEAIAHGIPVIGIHATAFPGPHPDLGLYQNIASSAAEIGQSQAAYVIAMSNGTARLLHMVDNSFAIARFKARAATEPVIHCQGCKFLEMVNVPIGDLAARVAPTVTGLLGRYGDGWWMTTCCDDYYPYVAASLHAAGVSPDKAHLVGADAPPATYDLIRRGNYEVASVPEPSSLFGYEAVDAVVHAMAGEAPAKFVQPTYIITKENVDAEGGKNKEFVPSNNFACQYLNIWKGTNNPC
jgi:ribose transport system substrate-binding protein